MINIVLPKEHKSSLLNKVYVEFTTVIVIAIFLFLLIDGNSFIINNKELVLMYCFLGIRFVLLLKYIKELYFDYNKL